MTLQLKDRVKETAAAPGTGQITLGGAVTGFQAFSAACANNDTIYYGISDGGANWEVGLGTYVSSGSKLTRTTVLASSNSGSAVNFTGAITVWGDTPASTTEMIISSGSYTPAILYGGANVGQTVNYARGDYVVRGNPTTGFYCEFDQWISLTARGSSTGPVTVNGPPVTCKNQANRNVPVTLFPGGMACSTGGWVVGLIGINSQLIWLYETGAAADTYNATPLVQGNMTDVAQIGITGRYPV